MKDRTNLHAQLNPLQCDALRLYTEDLFGGPFFPNRGSWGTEAEAAWALFTQHPKQFGARNLLHEWRASRTVVTQKK